MNRLASRVTVMATLSLGLLLSNCSSFDPTDIMDSMFATQKKPLPGDRKPLFPEGVPGVTQGIPPEFVKGNQPPPDNAEAAPLPAEPAKAAAAAAVDPDEKPKPKRKVKVAKQKLIPDNSPPPPQNQQTAPWPAQNQQQQQAPQQSSSAPWPSSGTTAR
jgi:hypothetical protein